MRLTFRRHTVRRRSLTVVLAALLWIGLSPGAWLSAHADGGRAAEPGTAVGWGENTLGQLGNGSTIGVSTTPVHVCGAAPCTSPLDRVLAVDAGGGHSVALRADGTVWTWGENTSGQLGNGTNASRTTPAQVCAVGETAPCDDFLSDVIAISAGSNHTMALRADGSVVAWGNNVDGQLGDGTNSNRNTPVEVCAVGATAPCGTNLLRNVTVISAGFIHSMAVATNGSVRTWGDNNQGQLGDGTNSDRNTPVEVCAVGATAPCGANLLSGVNAVAGGGFHSVAVRSDGTVRSWGDNASGQLGDGTNTDSNTPVQVCAVGATAPCGANLLTNVTSIAAGFAHSLAALSDLTVRSWGRNNLGQLGDGTNSNRNTPVPVSGLTNVTAIAAGADHSLAARTDGSARGWGLNVDGELGDGTTTNRNAPVKVCAFGQTAPCSRSLDGVTAIAGGTSHSLAIRQPSADVAIALSASPNSVASGANLTYTVTVRNNGTSAAENVVFNDTLPAEGRFVSATPSQGSCTVPPAGSSDTVTCSLGTLGNTQQATVQIVVTVRASSGSTVTNTATVHSSTPDPNEVNNSATIRTPVT